MAEQSGERTEDATPHRLREAREQGNVAKSQDVNAMAVVAALAGMLFALGWDSVRHLGTLQAKLLGNVRLGEWSPEVLGGLLGRLLVNGLFVLSPLMFIMLVTAIVINIAQIGPIDAIKEMSAELDAGMTWSSTARRSSTGWVTSGRSRTRFFQATSWECPARSGVRL